MSVSIFPFAVRLRRDQSPQEEEAMKYILLIHQGDTPTPQSPEDWALCRRKNRRPCTPTTGRSASAASPTRARRYGRALELVRSEAERRFLERRLAELP